MKNADMPVMPGVQFDDSGPPSYRPLISMGLTKRELFAMHAMQGLCANSIPGSHSTPNNLTREAIEYADTLLAALEDNQQ